MTLQLGDIAPDFEADTTEGRIRFHDWLGNSWGVIFSHPKDFTPVCTTELGYMAKIKPEFDKRGVKIIGLSVDPIDLHKKWADDIKETQGVAPNFPMIGDPDLSIAKLYGMLPASTTGTSQGRTPADNQTVRNVFVIGPDKKVKLILVYPMTTGRNFDEVLRVIELDAAHRQAPRGDPGQLEERRGCDHRRLGQRRRGEDHLPARLEVAQALYPDRAAAQRLVRRGRPRRADGIAEDASADHGLRDLRFGRPRAAHSPWSSSLRRLLCAARRFRRDRRDGRGGLPSRGARGDRHQG